LQTSLDLISLDIREETTLKLTLLSIAATVMVVCGAGPAAAQVWNVSGGGSWATGANWNPTSVPNAIGATAEFDSSSAANRSVTVDSASAGFAVGTITFNNAAGQSQTTTISTGTSGSKLILNNGGAGALINTNGTGTGKLAFNAAQLVLNENVVANVNQNTASSSTGSLDIPAVISGTGGFTKEGVGRMTFSTNAKTYTGATVLNNGPLRMSAAGSPTMTSSFTINNNATLEPTSSTNGGSFTLGSGPLVLNGQGFAPSGTPQGLIRSSEVSASGRGWVFNNNVTLQSNSLVHVQSQLGFGDRMHYIAFNGVVSGPGALIQTALDSDDKLGLVLLANANTYSGGTVVRGGSMEIFAAGSSANANFGTGNVTVMNPANVLTNATGIANAVSRLVIPSTATNAIADTATLSIEGGASTGFGPRAAVDLAPGVDEVVGSLVLGGVTQTAIGTYGSTTSPADFKSNAFFTNSGVIRLVTVPGDYNLDGKVDAADYVTWRLNPAAHGSDPAGYNTWRANFGAPGSGSGASANAAVPEPSTLLLMFAAIASCLRRGRSV
jgi:autotransporter-associated beta strand protein